MPKATHKNNKQREKTGIWKESQYVIPAWCQPDMSRNAHKTWKKKWQKKGGDTKARLIKLAKEASTDTSSPVKNIADISRKSQ